MGDIRVSVLGELTATYDGEALDLGGRRQRAVLGLLVLARGEVVPAERLVDSLWGDEPPPSAAAALQSYVSHLRKRLAPGSSARSRDGTIVSEGPGYALRLPPDAVDSWRFEQLLQQAAGCEPTAAAERLTEALGLWRGPALADYADEQWAEAEAVRLADLRAVAREQLLAARLGRGEAALLVPELEQLVADEPLREERWRLLVLALYRAQRQADALAALRRARTTLSDELGVDPGPALRALEAEVLAQSPGLDLPAPRFEAPRVVAVAVDPAAVPPGSDLVDRDREVGVLRGALDDLAAGDSRLVVVEGPAGIGKTRLLAELRTMTARRGLTTLNARGSQLERSFGFGAVRQLLEPVLLDPARRDQLLAGSAASARGVFDLLDTEERADGSFAVLHGLYWLTVNLAAGGPVVLVVDDLQWCDSGSLRYLAYLVRRLDSVPVLVVGTIRTGEQHEDEALLAELYDVAGSPVRPQPLSAEATAGMVRDRLGSEAATGFTAACHRTTSGNPLLLRQLLRALEAEGVRPDAAHADTVMAVGSRAVSSMVLMRLRRMPPDLTAVARAVAVLGEGAQLPTVAALAELPEEATATALAGLTRAEVVRHESPLGFVHPLVRDAVYRDLPPGELELQHERAARVLTAAGASDEQVAAHLLLGPRRGDAATVGVLRAAARTANDRGATDTAVMMLRRALDEPAVGRERVDVLLELGLTESLVDGRSSVLHLGEAFPFLEDAHTRGEVALTVARTHVFASPPGVATAFASDAARTLPADLVDARQGLVGIQRISGFMQGVDPALWRSDDEPTPEGDGHGAQMLAATLGWERALRGDDRERAVELARFALAGDRLWKVDNGLLWIVAANTRMLADDDLGDFWRRARVEAHARGSLFAALSTNLWRGFDEWRHGDLGEALQSVREGEEQSRMWGSEGIGQLFAWAFGIGICLDAGDVAGGRRIADRARAMPLVGEGGRLVHEAVARLLVVEGRPAEALLELDAAVDVSGILNPAWRPWRSLRAAALHGLGRSEEAVVLLEEEVELLRRWGAPSALGAGLRALGEVRGGAGLEQLREAVAVLEGSAAVLETAKARCALGCSPDVADDEARRLLEQALEAAHACGALALRQRAAEALQRRGHDVAAPCDDASLLTSTQRRILELTTSGLDVLEVAQELFLTPGTVRAELDALSAAR